MSLPVANLNDLTNEDLVALSENGVTESNTLEFKRQAYGNSDADKKEFLKDITAFANSAGGDLVLGVDERDGVATSLVPLSTNVEKEIDRMNQILRSGVEPLLVGVSIASVQVNSGACIILRIPRSPLAPHRVSAYNTSRFFVRHGRSAVEATMHELRSLFTRQREIRERAAESHARTIQAIVGGNPPSRPKGAGQTFIVLQMYPLQSLMAAEPTVDLANPAFLKLPLYGSPMGRSTLYAFDGVFNYESDGQRRARSLSTIYRSGVLEICEYDVLGAQGEVSVFPPSHVSNIAKAIKDGAKFLIKENLANDALVFCSVVNCQGARLVLGQTRWSNEIYEWEPIDRQVLTLPSVYLDSMQDNEAIMRDLRPIFDALWNAAGRSNCPHYDAKGNWTLP